MIERLKVFKQLLYRYNSVGLRTLMNRGSLAAERGVRVIKNRASNDCGTRKNEKNSALNPCNRRRAEPLKLNALCLDKRGLGLNEESDVLLYF